MFVLSSLFFCNSEKYYKHTQREMSAQRGRDMELHSKHKCLNAVKRRSKRKNTHTKNYTVLMLRTHLWTVRIATNRREKQMWFHLLQLWTLIAFHSYSSALSLSRARPLTFSLFLTFHFRSLISFTLLNNQQTHWSALVRFGPLRAVHLAVKLEIQLFQCISEWLLQPNQMRSGGDERGYSQACHKFNKISNEKCYFKNHTKHMQSALHSERQRQIEWKKSDSRPGIYEHTRCVCVWVLYAAEIKNCKLQLQSQCKHCCVP